MIWIKLILDLLTKIDKTIWIGLLCFILGLVAGGAKMTIDTNKMKLRLNVEESQNMNIQAAFRVLAAKAADCK